jgi:hypothetical protein
LLLQIQAWGAVSESRRRRLKGSALGVLLLGLFTKECTITAPVMLVLMDVIVCRSSWRQAVGRNRALLACLPIIPLHVLLISWVQKSGDLDPYALRPLPPPSWHRDRCGADAWSAQWPENSH